MKNNFWACALGRICRYLLIVLHIPTQNSWMYLYERVCKGQLWFWFSFHIGASLRRQKTGEPWLLDSWVQFLIGTWPVQWMPGFLCLELHLHYSVYVHITMLRNICHFMLYKNWKMLEVKFINVNAPFPTYSARVINDCNHQGELTYFVFCIMLLPDSNL